MTTAAEQTSADAAPRHGERRTGLALALFAALVLLAHVWGDVVARSTRIGLATPPLHAVWDPRATVASVFVVALAGTIVVAGPSVAQRVGDRCLPWAVGVAGAAWSTALALTDGRRGLTGGVVGPHGYLAAVPKVGSPGRFLRGFADAASAGTLPVHVAGHPPGFVLGLWSLARAGLDGPGAAAALCILGGAAALGFVTVATRAVGGAAAARAAAPFLVLAPSAVWIATTPDAFFACFGAAAIALFCLAAVPIDHRWSPTTLALASGLCFGVALMLSYGIVLLAVIAIAVAVRYDARPQLVVAGLTATAVLSAFALLGFSWLEGLQATRHAYWDGIASTRPYRYFVVANVAAFAVCIGPATVVAVTWLRDRALALLVGSALVAVAIANLSAMSKGEVERIWLPFALFVLPANAVFAARGNARRMLALQALTAVAVQALFRTS